MRHALCTFVAPLVATRLAETEAAIDRLGNPARADIRAALDKRDGEAGTHFVSLHAIRSVDQRRCYILLELSADGTNAESLDRVVSAIGDHLRPIFMLAADWKDGADLVGYLRGHAVEVGAGWLDNPGVCFMGTPGLSVGRIHLEHGLTVALTPLASGPSAAANALERVSEIRAKLAATRPDLAGELDRGPADPSFSSVSGLGLIAPIAWAAVRTFLWPVGLVLALWGFWCGWQAAAAGDDHWLSSFLCGLTEGLLRGAWIALALLLLTAVLGYLAFVRAEARDYCDERPADRAVNAAMFARENRCAQNHMTSITQLKPGLIRRFTMRLVFLVVGELAARSFRPGMLGDIGTIHFARWVMPPSSPDLIFLSNYDASWESYLEDFITQAHAGLTGVWSNTIGFPRTKNLIGKGATDGERFKRFARRSMVPTRFWYSAYPSLSTTSIRRNADIRRGLSGSMTEDEAIAWLALFGSEFRPQSKLISSEIQSIVFGGLIFMQHGTCLLLDLSDDVAANRQWLQDIYGDIAFDDGRRWTKPALTTLALSPRGLTRLGLPQAGVDTFPFVFLEGMTTSDRSRVLGDVGPSAPENWRWGRERYDVALLIYGKTEDAKNVLLDKIKTLVTDGWGARQHEILLRPLQNTMIDGTMREPFGFADGISQPVIRGTHKAMRSADPIHIVEPGEFILGYPDNRGNVPPGPTLPALNDPANQLPLAGTGTDFKRTVVESPRSLGLNGSFLAIRELEQDVDAFWGYCRQASQRLSEAGGLTAPMVASAEFVAAKLVGRWQDGSALVRHPYEPPGQENANYQTEAMKPENRRQKSPNKMSTLESVNSLGVPSTSRPRARRGESTGIESGGVQSRENDFLFGEEDPQGLRCPFGAHVRRANPRDSFDAGSTEQISISNRHRILRIGRQYEPRTGGKPGLLFMCLNGDIERQYEFVQQTWLNSASFQSLSDERDPLLHDGGGTATGFTIPTPQGPVRLSALRQFVTTRGGGYFFLPGKRLLDYLKAPR